jgi:hypothetical protein
MLTAKLGLDQTYVQNYVLKLNTKAVFMSDRLGDLTGPFALTAVVISMGLLIVGACWGSAPKGVMTNAARHSRRARDAQTALRSKFRRRIYTRAGIALNIAKLPELLH